MRVRGTWKAAGVFLVAFLGYLTGLNPGVAFEDTGEMLAAAATLGNTHPPGYPLYALSTKLAFLLPAGSPAFRGNILSAVLMSLSVLVLWRVALMLTGSQTAAVIAGASFLFSRTAWWQAGLSDKYPMITLFCALALMQLFRARPETGWKRETLKAVSFGFLASGYHFMGLILLFPLVILLFGRLTRRSLAIALVMGVLVMSPRIIYPPLRAGHTVPLLRAVPGNLGTWMDYEGARVYTKYNLLARAKPAEIARAMVKEVFTLPWGELGPVLLLSTIGIAWGIWSRNGPVIGVLIPAIAANVVLALLYLDPEVQVGRYFLPSYWLLALLAGLGTGWLSARFGRKVGVATAVAAIVIEILSSAGYARRDMDYTAPDHVRNILATVPDPPLSWPGTIYGCFH